MDYIYKNDVKFMFMALYLCAIINIIWLLIMLRYCSLPKLWQFWHPFTMITIPKDMKSERVRESYLWKRLLLGNWFKIIINNISFINITKFIQRYLFIYLEYQMVFVILFEIDVSKHSYIHTYFTYSKLFSLNLHVLNLIVNR